MNYIYTRRFIHTSLVAGMLMKAIDSVLGGNEFTQYGRQQLRLIGAPGESDIEEARAERFFKAVMDLAESRGFNRQTLEDLFKATSDGVSEFLNQPGIAEACQKMQQAADRAARARNN